MAEEEEEHQPAELNAGRLMDVIAENNQAGVSVLLEAGADVNALNFIGAAAQHGNPEIVAMLLKKGADCETKDDRGDTAAMRAATKGHAEAFIVLCEAGADLEARDMFGGQTILQVGMYIAPLCPDRPRLFACPLLLPPAH